VRGDVGDVVHDPHDPGRVDQEAPPAWISGVRIVGRAGDAVRLADVAIGVAEEAERELLIGGELVVLVDGVEGGAEDDRAVPGEVVGAVTQRLSFDRSTGRRRLRVPPQQHPRATQVGEPDDVAVLVGELEIGCRISASDHRPILSQRRMAADRDGTIGAIGAMWAPRKGGRVAANWTHGCRTGNEAAGRRSAP
jgi:hypothetical protein